MILIKKTKNLGAVGFYIFALVDYDYNEVDNKTRRLIDQLIVKHSAYKLAYMADEYVKEFPEIKLRALLSKIEENAFYFEMPLLEERHELDY